MDCPEARISLGVYVLGAIDPAERALVDAHLATCRDCRDELAGLAGLPALLARVSMEEAIALADDRRTRRQTSLDETPEPPRELLATVLDLTAARRRRRRWREAGLGRRRGADHRGRRVRRPAARVEPARRSTSAQGPAGLYVGPLNGPMETATGKSGAMTATVSYRPMGWGTAA